MAEGFLKKMLREKGESARIRVLSAGLNALGWPPTEEAANVMKMEGIDISGFRSKRLNQELVKEADLVLTMEQSHKDSIISLLPQYADKVFTLKEFAGETEELDINDPYGSGFEAYEACAKEVKLALAKAFDKTIKYLLEEEEDKK